MLLLLLPPPLLLPPSPSLLLQHPAVATPHSQHEKQQHPALAASDPQPRHYNAAFVARAHLPRAGCIIMIAIGMATERRSSIKASLATLCVREPCKPVSSPQKIFGFVHQTPNAAAGPYYSSSSPASLSLAAASSASRRSTAAATSGRRAGLRGQTDRRHFACSAAAAAAVLLRRLLLLLLLHGQRFNVATSHGGVADPGRRPGPGARPGWAAAGLGCRPLRAAAGRRAASGAPGWPCPAGSPARAPRGPGITIRGD